MSMYFHEFNPNYVEFCGIIAATGVAILAAKWLGGRFGASVIRRKKTTYDRVNDVRVTKEYAYGEAKIVTIKVVSDFVDHIMGFVTAMIFVVGMMMNCFTGIVQVFDNSLGANDSGAWSVIFALAGVGFVGWIAGTLGANAFHKAKLARYYRFGRYFAKKGCKVHRRQAKTPYVFACEVVKLIKAERAEKKAAKAEKAKVISMNRARAAVRNRTA